MDLMKTILIYMAATMAMAVQTAGAPEVTPVPVTPPPAVEEIMTPAPETTPAPTAAPSVTPVPVPTITPNTRDYHNLTQGTKGAEVKRLQERLIELGYLPEGAADGSYGRQTRNAVRTFQYYNGLTQDGVAGRATQTNLFENPAILSYQQATATAAPTEEPTAEPTAAPTDVPQPSPTPKTPIINTGMLWWPVPVLLIVGISLVLFGIARRRREDA